MRILVHKIGAFDIHLSRKISFLAGKRFLDGLMYWISRSGDGYLYGLFAVAMLTGKIAYGTKMLTAGAISFAVELGVQKAVKHLVRRERPCLDVGTRYRMSPPDKFSFPSGHTAGAFLMATIVGFFYPLWSIALYVWAVLMGFSRIYNGMHYTTDVIMGCVLGVSTAYLGLGIVM